MKCGKNRDGQNMPMSLYCIGDLQGCNAPFQRLLEQANQALGRLDGLSTLLNVPLFLYNYVRKEAVLSSQIEGTQSSLSDLLLFESDQARAFQPWTCTRFPTTSPRLHLESNGLRLFPCHSG